MEQVQNTPSEKNDLRIVDDSYVKSSEMMQRGKWLRRIVVPILVVLATTSLLVPHVIYRITPIPWETTMHLLEEAISEGMVSILTMIERSYADIGHGLLILAALFHAYLLYRESREEPKYRSFRNTLTGIWCSIAVLTATGLFLHNVDFVMSSNLEVHT